jgi:hypothetical protein
VAISHAVRVAIAVFLSPRPSDVRRRSLQVRVADPRRAKSSTADGPAEDDRHLVDGADLEKYATVRRRNCRYSRIGEEFLGAQDALRLIAAEIGADVANTKEEEIARDVVSGRDMDRARRAIEDRNTMQASDRRGDRLDIDGVDALSLTGNRVGRSLRPGETRNERERYRDRDSVAPDDYFPIRRFSSSRSASALA